MIGLVALPYSLSGRGLTMSQTNISFISQIDFKQKMCLLNLNRKFLDVIIKFITMAHRFITFSKIIYIIKIQVPLYKIT